mgnify:CR=1 FL=1
MKDPLGVMGKDTIFVMSGYNSNQLKIYRNIVQFKSDNPKETITLPYYFHGTGAVVYGRYLYYKK